MPSDKNAKIETWLKPVSYARLAAVSHAFQRRRICPFPAEELLGRVRSAIEAAGFWNLHEIDSQALLSHEGYAISPARQLLSFHPPAGLQTRRPGGAGHGLALEASALCMSRTPVRKRRDR